MLMRDLTVAIRILAMVVSRGSVLLSLLMVAPIVVMRRLPVVMRRQLMLRSGMVMVFGGWVLLFLGHGNFLLQTISVPDVSGQRARPTFVTNFITVASAGKLPTWRHGVFQDALIRLARQTSSPVFCRFFRCVVHLLPPCRWPRSPWLWNILLLSL